MWRLTIALGICLFFAFTVEAGRRRCGKAVANPLRDTRFIDFIDANRPKDIFGIGPMLMEDYYLRLLPEYRFLEEVVYYSLYWPNQSNFKNETGDWVIDFPPGVSRTEKNIYYVRQVRQPWQVRSEQDFYDIDRPEGIREELTNHVKVALDEMVRRGVITAKDAEKYLKIERTLSLRRTAYFTYRDVETKETEAVMRLIDGSGNPITYAGDRGQIAADNVDDDSRINAEIMFPWLELPERKNGEPVYELGRLGKHIFVIDGLLTLCRSVTDYFFNKEGFMGESEYRGTIYILSPPGGTELFQSDDIGFTLVMTPEQLKIPKADTQLSLLKMSVKEFMRRFSFNPHIMPIIRR